MSMMGSYRIVLAAPMLAGIVLFAPLPAAAQKNTMDVTINGPVSLSAINSGDVTLKGNIYHPEVTGTNNTVSLVAQGAVVNYDAQSDIQSITDQSTGNVSVTVSKANWNASNSGSSNVKGTINDINQPTQTGNATISAVGLQSGITINTRGKN